MPDRIQGWRDAMQAHNVQIDESLIFPTTYTREGGYQATLRMIASQKLPRALFASNEGRAIGCIRVLSQHGIRVPKDVAMVCFNGTEQSAYHVPALTTVRQPVKRWHAALSIC